MEFPPFALLRLPSADRGHATGGRGRSTAVIAGSRPEEQSQMPYPPVEATDGTSCRIQRYAGNLRIASYNSLISVG